MSEITGFKSHKALPVSDVSHDPKRLTPAHGPPNDFTYALQPIIVAINFRIEVQMDAEFFWNVFKDRGINLFSGVPDSTFGEAYNQLVIDPEIRYVPAVREDVALGIASSAFFNGDIGAVIMQNSGIGNIVNTLSSFSMMYHIPVLLIIGWRGYGGPPNDAPEHWIMGSKTTDILELFEIPYTIVEPNSFENTLEGLLKDIQHSMCPGAFLVRPGIVQ